METSDEKGSECGWQHLFQQERSTDISVEGPEHERSQQAQQLSGEEQSRRKISIYGQGPGVRGMSAVMFCWHVLMREEVGEIRGTASGKDSLRAMQKAFKFWCDSE